jgi:hypothetical protein
MKPNDSHISPWYLIAIGLIGVGMMCWGFAAYNYWLAGIGIALMLLACIADVARIESGKNKDSNH